MESSLLEPDVRRHKRTFAQMSHRISLSPSPVFSRDPAPSDSSRSSQYTPPPSNNNAGHISPLMDRRRHSHPHNHSLPLPRRQDDNPEAQRPRLEHRTSQTIIDLTDADDPDLEFVAVRNRSENARRQHIPPRLGRSDAESLEAVIDLTDDSDVVIMGDRQITLPQPPPRINHNQVSRQPNRASPPLFVAENHLRPPWPVIPAFVGLWQGNRSPFHNVMQIAPDDPRRVAFGPVDYAALAHHLPGQALPQNLNYGNHAFVEQKPAHVAPKPAREDFTRSPTENDVVICPSCGEELVHRPESDEPPTKKSGRALSKKEREEHPFWVVKECGHVYCNSCFHNRTSRTHPKFTFPEIGPSASKKKSSIRCAVEACESEVKEKSRWVGVFI